MTLKRQGDILLELTGRDSDSIGEHISVVADGVIARGEVTGHAHVLTGAALVMDRGAMLAVVDDEDEATVVHDEHGSLELDPGVWLVHRQTEYSGPDEEIQVHD